MTLDEAKRSMSFLLQTINRPEAGQHVICCFHDQRAPGSLRIWQDEKGYCWYKCYVPSCPGSEKGSVVDAYMVLHNCDFKEAIQAMHIESKYTPKYTPNHVYKGERPNEQYEQKRDPTPSSSQRNINTRFKSQSKRFGPPPPPPLPDLPEPMIPVPDVDKMTEFLDRTVSTLLESSQLQEYLFEKRKIIMDVADQYMLGVDRVSYRKGKIVRCQWIIPIIDNEGHVRAVKTHWQNPPKRDDGRSIPKSGWKGFGTQPQPTEEAPHVKPRHGWATVWPPPEFFNKKETLFIFPGELKAAAALSMGGIQATSITAGEAYNWTPGEIIRISGWREIVVVYDPDDAGKTFRDKTIQTFEGRVDRILNFTCRDLLTDCEDSCQ